VIRQTDLGDYVISSRGRWLPGSYATQAAARWAFQFRDETLAALCRKINGAEGRPITTEDLRAQKRADDG
jgi:hypothetical protein